MASKALIEAGDLQGDPGMPYAPASNMQIVPGVSSGLAGKAGLGVASPTPETRDANASSFAEGMTAGHTR
eukprot:CAMPEP_0115600988 /NCGR_PEP_ID=MMETSP0272-20121206/15170_1 /TAXON_ID=71861 /ORGANISM="Scrippsiella trochoidea, Strain CCMP3099" /LENGTH=69 /DNA_ID=CAMNT_0003036445 /DNA_START=185 /DNA_END=390 /DNA_ORIENTATION=-